MHIKLKPECFQDGPDFYLEETEEHGAQLLASYPQLVQGDWDMDGARLAREHFALQFPELIQK